MHVHGWRGFREAVPKAVRQVRTVQVDFDHNRQGVTGQVGKKQGAVEAGFAAAVG